MEEGQSPPQALLHRHNTSETEEGADDCSRTRKGLQREPKNTLKALAFHYISLHSPAFH